MASQRLMKERPEFEESWKLVLEEWTGIVPNFKLTHTPDRTIAIVLSTIVEHALERALCTHFVISKQEHLGLFHGQGDEDAPLHSFASKIALGYALGIYEQRCRTELRWIKNIRNAFAHSEQHLAFDTPDVALMVKALQTHG
ncbi:MAG: hypothetical protein HC869_22005, partial [Rhodospirillales bacterium]|nr:hypothetical protein [Rhodospirillales bacterium]